MLIVCDGLKYYLKVEEECIAAQFIPAITKPNIFNFVETIRLKPDP